MQWITFCTLHYTLCRSADFNWITHCVIQRKITSNDNSFIPMHTWWSIMPCIPRLAFPFQSPCWNQKAWNHIHRTWIIRYKLCHCLRKKKCRVLIHISGPILYANHFVQHKSAVLQSPISFTCGTNVNLQQMPIFSPVFAVSPMSLPTTSLE